MSRFGNWLTGADQVYVPGADRAFAEGRWHLGLSPESRSVVVTFDRPDPPRISVAVWFCIQRVCVLAGYAR